MDPMSDGTGTAAIEQRDTVRVRIKLLMNAGGKWAAYGWNDATDDDATGALYAMMGDEEVDTARTFYLIAEIPKPQPVEIAASVEAGDAVAKEGE